MLRAIARTIDVSDYPNAVLMPLPRLARVVQMMAENLRGRLTYGDLTYYRYVSVTASLLWILRLKIVTSTPPLNDPFIR